MEHRIPGPEKAVGAEVAFLALFCYFEVARSVEFVHVCQSIDVVYNVRNGEEMCFQFHLIENACLRFCTKLSFLYSSDEK